MGERHPVPWWAAIPGACIFVAAAGAASFTITLGIGSAYRLMTWWWP